MQVLMRYLSMFPCNQKAFMANSMCKQKVEWITFKDVPEFGHWVIRLWPRQRHAFKNRSAAHLALHRPRRNLKHLMLHLCAADPRNRRLHGCVISSTLVRGWTTPTFPYRVCDRFWGLKDGQSDDVLLLLTIIDHLSLPASPDRV